MNNKRKSLAKAKVIINIDFPQEFINQYIIYEKAIIVDINQNIKSTRKRFEGVVIQDYDICVRNEWIIDEQCYLKKDLYEAEFYKRQPYEYVREKIKRDRTRIVSLQLLDNGLI